jgi:4'-phosphopantetheinyl transferase
MTLRQLWHQPSQPPALARDEIHVWRASVSEDAHAGKRLRWALGDDERARAEHFRFNRDRDRFVFRRALMKLLLAQYLGADVPDVRFKHGRCGKPTLAPPFDRADLQFNLSHSNGMVLFAIARGRKVGVDVEYIRPDVEIEQIARLVFSEREASGLTALPASDRLEAFFACWTRKEAFVKATGQGFSRALEDFDVSLAPGGAAALVSTREDPTEAARWSLEEVRPGSGYCAALAAEGHDWQVRCWDAREALVRCVARE